MAVSAFSDLFLSSTLISLIIMVSFYVSEQFLLPGRQNALHCLMFLEVKVIATLFLPSWSLDSREAIDKHTGQCSVLCCGL